MSGKTLKASCWSRINKKNITKQININKFNGNEDEAREFLNKWKEDFKQNELKEMNKEPDINKEIENEMKNDKNIECIEEAPEIKEEGINPEIIKYTKFNLEMPDLNETGGSVVIFGAAKSGKSTQIINLIKRYYNNKDIISIFISPNAHIKLYEPLKKMNVILIDRWSEQLIADLYKIQKKTDNKYKILIAIDDVIDERNSGAIRKLFLILRNCKISTILNLQSVTLMDKNSRNNANNIIFRHWNNDAATEESIKYFLGSFEPFYSLPNMQDKIRYYREATKDYSFIYLDALSGEVSFHKSK